MSVDEDGDLLCMPASWDGDSKPPIITVAHKDAARQKPPSGVGDRLLARLKSAGDDTYDAKIIKPIGRGAHRFLAVFRESKSGGFADPVERRARNSFSIERTQTKGARDGDLVWIEAAARRGGGMGRARVREIAGHIDDAHAYTLIALAAHDIPVELPADVVHEADRAPSPTMKDRTDLRETPLLTIDPDDAKDHDDAVFAAPDENSKNAGGWRIIVAIADVSWFVRPGSRIDAEAQNRGNSVYLPDRVVPMLPEKLSNDLCSLRENTDRPCIAVEMTIDAHGRKTSHRFLRAMMRSVAKLSYADAQNFITDPKAKGVGAQCVRNLHEAFKTRWKERAKRAPLDLDLPERKVILKPDGTVDKVVKRERYDAHRMIEEFMILANVAAAETLEQKRTPQIYRVHDAPDPEKLNSVRDYLEDLDYSLAKGAVRPSQFNQILKIAGDRGQQEMISDVILRSQRQAVYSTENAGHFGLNLPRYSHFTSPIRRYADLTIHRALVAACKLGEGAQTEKEASRLPKIAEAVSDLERRAVAAEREANDRYLAGYMENHIGEEFDGRIRGVTRFGLFVMLDETGADGFVPTRTLGAERFEFHEDRHAMIGADTGGAYRLGQAVRVSVVESAPLRGGLIFEMITEPVENPDFEPSVRRRKHRSARPKGSMREGKRGNKPRKAGRSGKKKRR
ncbi:MAG: ribonuclease R [Parvularculaceae bacterium]